jgi:S1-C subfamily serine protease
MLKSMRIPGTVILVGLIVGLAVGLWIRNGETPTTNGDRPSLGVEEETTVVPYPRLLEDEANTVAVFDAASPSVVNIESVSFQRTGYSLNVTKMQKGVGTGFIWDSEGHVVTNAHVVNGGGRFMVSLANGTTSPGEFVGSDPSKDLAVLRLLAPDPGARPIPRGKSSELRVGQKVLAIGNPFGLDQTLTVGVISAMDREIEAINGRTIMGVIQTDAAINPGNSGGPLLDSHGRLVGINSAIVSPSGSSAGIGFAVPVDIVRRVVPDLIAHGVVVRAGLGVRILSDQLSDRHGIEGVVIASVPSGSPAEKAGLRGLRRDSRGSTVLGDVIVAVQEHRVRDSNDLANALEPLGVGAQCTISILRGEHTVDVSVELQRLE